MQLTLTFLEARYPSFLCHQVVSSRWRLAGPGNPAIDEPDPKAPNKSTSPPPELIGSAQVAARLPFPLPGQGRPRAGY
jgi:hypothetical protein